MSASIIVEKIGVVITRAVTKTAVNNVYSTIACPLGATNLFDTINFKNNHLINTSFQNKLLLNVYVFLILL